MTPYQHPNYKIAKEAVEKILEVFHDRQGFSDEQMFSFCRLALEKTVSNTRFLDAFTYALQELAKTRKELVANESTTVE